jgi:hypothetical protein
MAVGIGERVAYGNVPAWVEGFGFVRNEAIRQSARFIARDGPGIAYAFGREGDDFFVRVASASLPGFFNAPRTDEIVIASKNAKRRSLLLAASTRSIGDAAAQLWIERGEQRAAIPRGLPASARVEVARCPELGGHREPFARFSPTDAAVVVPLECFEARVWAPGHGPSAWVTLAAVGSLTLPPVGTLAVRATEGSEPVPVRVQVRGIEGTPSADWGEDPDDGAALDTLATETGVAERPLAPGRYRVIVDRGFEYSAHDELVTIRAGERTSVLARLDRVVDTRGFVAADLHLHAIPSMDAPQSLEDRLRGVAAAGVEVAVATDHNRITDYAPTIRALGLDRHVARVIGDEITTEDIGFGHFNVFPLEAGSAPLLFERTSPSAIFAEARGRAPLFDANVIQVNHPRMGDIGYFDVMRFDRDDIAAFRRRSPEADLGFDALEVYNGDHYVEIPEVEEVMRDWYALLDSGLHVMATGNSDSHRFSFHEAGVPRTYVEIGDEDLARFDHRGFIASIRAGRGMVSGGPFVRLTVAGQGIGRTVPGGTHEVVVTVDAPPWIDVSEVEIVRRGVVVERITAPEGATPVTELRTRLTLTRGDWIIAIARGRREMSVLRKRGGMPFSFTNPVWVQ